MRHGFRSVSAPRGITHPVRQRDFSLQALDSAAVRGMNSAGSSAGKTRAARILPATILLVAWSFAGGGELTAQEPGSETPEALGTQAVPLDASSTDGKEAATDAADSNALDLPVVELDVVPAEWTSGWARVTADQATVRCFETVESPRYDDVLPAGTVVGAGELYGTFRRVQLPYGPLGFVHKEYTTTPEGGIVRTKGRGVSFRYRARTGELPVETLDDGVELLVVGESDDWWHVRCKVASAWLAVSEVEVLPEGAPEATTSEAFATLADQHLNGAETFIALGLVVEAEANRVAEEKAGFDALRALFDGELSKPVEEREFAPVRKALAAFSISLPAESPLVEPIRSLDAAAEKQEWVVEATRAAREPVKPMVLEKRLIEPPPKDGMSRFDGAVGWLRYHPSKPRQQRFVLEKGGQVLFWVDCRSGRYDLALFEDMEVGLIGERSRPNRESMRILDVKRLEVIAIPRAKR